MATDDLISRTDAGALIPEDVATEILGGTVEQSAVMRLGRELPNMSRKQRRIPVWTSLPSAYFVNGDTGLKQTTKALWDNVYLNAEELAVIVVVPDAVADDADYDIFEQMKPQISTAIGAAFDQAVIYGINAPSSWQDPLLNLIQEAGHDVTVGEVGDLYDDLLGEGGVLNKVEEDGFGSTGAIAHLRMKAKLRGLRDENGQPIFTSALMADGATQYALDGEPILFPTNGAMDASRALLVAGDWNQLVWATRQDMTYKVLTEAVITDSEGNIEINLAQQDAKALRVVTRVAWACPNPLNRINGTTQTRFPFASLEPVAAS